MPLAPLPAPLAPSSPVSPSSHLYGENSAEKGNTTKDAASRQRLTRRRAYLWDFDSSSGETLSGKPIPPTLSTTGSSQSDPPPPNDF